ncbi:Cyclin-like [Sesbania bispinosa]|nr:Cyclin-like [Sesbania bispinosa]
MDQFDLENPLKNFHDVPCDAVSSLFLIESDHIPPPNYFQSLKASDFDISVRRDVISLISQLSCTFDPFLPYLAINYLDRFLANQGQPKPWTNKLLAISCFSLAAKMLKTEYSATDVQALMNHGDGSVIFETQTIQRMEALVLGALQWRMRSITPFSFIPFFSNLFMINDTALRQVLKDRASQIILKSQRDLKVLEFKPSIVAASALLYASHELFPFQYPCFLRAISDCSYVNKESVVQCYNVIEDTAREEYESVFNVNSSSDTPVNVLDEHFLSLESEKTNGTNAAPTTLIHEKDYKRRKITDYGSTVQFSHFH